MKTQKSILLSICAIALMTVMVYAGTGSIRIDPPLPDGRMSPAEFEIWVQGKSEANEPHILLVITESCYQGLSEVEDVVSWNGDSESVTIPKNGWTKETVNNVKVPPGTTSGAGYTVASLKDHLGTDGPIYYAFVPLWDGSLGSTKIPIKVTLHSSDPKMLVYILGICGDGELYDMRVPPTIPGFVVPEVPYGAITSMLAMMGALYSQMRTKKPL